MRGLNTPPRNPTAPRAATADAVASICSVVSTAHGPAITATEPSPIVVVPRRTSVPAGRNALPPNHASQSRRTCLVGAGRSAPAVCTASTSDTGRT